MRQCRSLAKGVALLSKVSFRPYHFKCNLEEGSTCFNSESEEKCEIRDFLLEAAGIYFLCNAHTNCRYFYYMLTFLWNIFSREIAFKVLLEKDGRNHGRCANWCAQSFFFFFFGKQFDCWLERLSLLVSLRLCCSTSSFCKTPSRW